MITLNLLRAEWLKTRKRLIYRVMLALFPAFLCLLMGMIIVLALVNPAEFRGEANDLLPYPTNLRMGISVINEQGLLLVVVFMAMIVGSEYGRDTWKAILPRYGSRSAFLLAKWIVGLCALPLFVLAIMAVVLPLGWFGTLLLDVSPDPNSTLEPAMYIRRLLVTLLSYVFIGTLTLFATVLTRSTIGGVVIGMLLTTGLVFIRDILPMLLERAPLLTKTVAWLLPVTHFSNLRERWAMDIPPAETLMALLVDRPVPLVLNVLVVLAHTVLLLAASLYSFSRRDMAGE